MLGYAGMSRMSMEVSTEIKGSLLRRLRVYLKIGYPKNFRVHHQYAMTDLTNKDDYLGYIKIWCSVLTHTQFLWLQLLKPSTRQHMTTRHRMSPKTQWHSAYPQIQHVETWRSMARLRTSHNHSMTFGKSRSWPASSHIVLLRPWQDWAVEA